MFNEGLLVAGQKGVYALFRADVPPVANEVAFGVIDREANTFPLRFGEAFVKLHRQRVLGGSMDAHEGSRYGSRSDDF